MPEPRRGVREPDGFLRLLVESGDPGRILRLHLDDSELVGEGDRLPDGGHGETQTGRDVRIHHLAEVHAVDVVGADDHDDVGLLVAHQVEALEDGVGGAAEPALSQALLGGHGGHVGIQQARQPPGLRHVAVEAV